MLVARDPAPVSSLRTGVARPAAPPSSICVLEEKEIFLLRQNGEFYLRTDRRIAAQSRRHRENPDAQRPAKTTQSPQLIHAFSPIFVPLSPDHPGLRPGRSWRC